MSNLTLEERRTRIDAIDALLFNYDMIDRQTMEDRENIIKLKRERQNLMEQANMFVVRFSVHYSAYPKYTLNRVYLCEDGGFDEIIETANIEEINRLQDDPMATELDSYYRTYYKKP